MGGDVVGEPKKVGWKSQKARTKSETLQSRIKTASNSEATQPLPLPFHFAMIMHAGVLAKFQNPISARRRAAAYA